MLLPFLVIGVCSKATGICFAVLHQYRITHQYNASCSCQLKSEILHHLHQITAALCAAALWVLGPSDETLVWLLQYILTSHVFELHLP